MRDNIYGIKDRHLAGEKRVIENLVHGKGATSSEQFLNEM